MKLGSIVLLSILFVPPAAHAAKRNAKSSYERGLQHFQSKRYAKAAKAFEASHRTKKSVQALYGWAQSERLLGNCIEAVGLYREVLTMELTPTQNQRTLAALALCADAVPIPSKEPPAMPRADPGPPATAPSVSKVDSGASVSLEHRRWYEDPFGHTLVGVGVVGVGIGIALFFKSSSDAANASSAENLQAYDDRRSSARTLRTVSLISLGLGSTLAAVGVYRYLTIGNKPAPISFWLDSQGGQIAWQGTF